MDSKKQIAKEDKALAEKLVHFFSAQHKKFYGTETPPKELSDLKRRAKILVKEASKNHTLRAISKDDDIVAIVLRAPSKDQRIKGQQSIAAYYEPRMRKAVMPWLQHQIHEAAMKSPRFTQFGLLPDEDAYFREPLEAAGFGIRYEVLKGETKKALRGLIREKNPPRDLSHLGLEIKAIASKKDLPTVMALQEKVSLQSKAHTYFGHSKEQLARDKKEYERTIKSGEGMILGVYKKTRLLGLMIGGIHQETADSEKNGGFSFFLDKSIQGKGIVKTGYRILLENFAAQGVRYFHGGTSQPAVQALGKVMKRKTQFIVYLKMK